MEPQQQTPDARLQKIELWMNGGVGADGKPIPGLLRTIETLALLAADLKAWIVRLGAAIATGVFGNAFVSFLHYLGLLGK